MRRTVEEHKFYEEEIVTMIPMIYRYIYIRVGKQNVAQDLVQVVLLKTWMNLHQLRERKKVKAWVMMIVKHTLSAHYTKSKREPIYVGISWEDLYNYTYTEKDPTEEVERKEDQKFICEVIETLEPREKLILKMHYYDDIPLKDIAKEMGINYNTVRIISRRAVQKIRKKWDIRELVVSRESGKGGKPDDENNY